MDTLNSLTAELYFWGHFDVLQNAAEEFAKKGSVGYQKILTEKVEHHLRSNLDQLPLHQSLNEAVKEWFRTAEFFSKKCPDWKYWKFPSEKELENEKTFKEKEYLLPVMHLCKLAVDAFDVASDGRLCRSGEENMILFKRFGCVPPNLIGATRYAMKPGLRWGGKNVAATSQAAAQEFQVLIQRGLADAHVHLSGAACFSDLLYSAIRGIAPPRPFYGGFGFLENGKTHGSHDFPFHNLAVRPLLLACKAMLAFLLLHAEKSQTNFEKLLDDNALSRQFWNLTYLAAKEMAEKKQGGNSAMRFYMVVDNVLKRVGNYKRFFDKSITFEKNWFTIVRHVLESQTDRVLCYHFSQLTRCISCLYRPMFHREGFYEFDHLFRYLDILVEASGNPKGRPPRRVPEDVPLERIGYDSMQNQCKYLKHLQLRMTVRAERKRPSCREPRKNVRKPLVTKKRMEVELLNHLKTYKKYIEEQKNPKCWFCKSQCPDCGKNLPKSESMTITFPIHFIRREMGDGKTHRKEFQFKLIWHRMKLLASLFQDKPVLRYFFGRIDVANNEDLKPNWIFALVFRELEDRLKKKIPTLSGDIDIPGMRYNCHAGEHFTSSIQGLRRIWEPVRYFPRLDGIGHAFALGIPGRMPAEMSADELIDDLVWVLLHRDYIHGIPLEGLIRIGEEIAAEIYNTEFDGKNELIDEILFRDLKDAYLWRFEREKVAKYIGILSHDKKTGEYHYVRDFRLPKEDTNNPFPTAAKIMRKHFTQKEVGRSYKLPKEIRDTLDKCYPFLRDYVKQEIIKKNVVVEVCPASNFRIGNLTRIEDHPLFVMCPPDKNGGISTVFGTDNPAMFQTSIDSEYLFVKEAMDKKYPELPQEKRLEYLETIRRRSMELCCDDLPDDPIAILELIEKACSSHH